MKRGTPNHPKTLELAKILKIPRVYAVGILEQLFHFTAEYAPKGDIGKHSDSRIAAAFDRDERSGAKLIRALIEARWIDEHSSHRLVVHDWLEHATTGTKNRVAAIDKVESSNQHVKGKRRESHYSDAIVSPPVSPPVTHPPALPSLTKPSQALPSSGFRKASEGIEKLVGKSDDSPPSNPDEKPEGASEALPTVGREEQLVLMRDSLLSYVKNALPPPDRALIEQVLDAGNGASVVEIHHFLRKLYTTGHEPRHGPGPKSWGWFPTVVAAHFRKGKT